MSTDWRALCAELADTLERAQRALRFEGGCSDATDSKRRALIDRARAALAAEPVAEGPTPSDEELLKLARAELNNSPNWEEPEYDASNPFPYEAPGIAWLNFARAALARWGRPAPAPAGDVAAGVKWLRMFATGEFGSNSSHPDARQLRRISDLLEQRQAAPVPAGEVAESSVAPVPEPALARINGILSDSGRVLLTDVREALELAREALQQRQAAPVPAGEVE